MNEFNQNGGSVELLDRLKTKRPKKALSAYMIFVRENRSLISHNNPHLSALEIMKEVGQRWQALTDKEKQVYEKKAVNDKKRYETELAKFEKEIESISGCSPKKNEVIKEEKKSKGKESKVIKPKTPTKKLRSGQKREENVQTPMQKTQSLRKRKMSVSSKSKSKTSGRRKGKDRSKPSKPFGAFIYFSQEVSHPNILLYVNFSRSFPHSSNFMPITE